MCGAGPPAQAQEELAAITVTCRLRRLLSFCRLCRFVACNFRFHELTIKKGSTNHSKLLKLLRRRQHEDASASGVVATVRISNSDRAPGTKSQKGFCFAPAVASALCCRFLLAGVLLLCFLFMFFVFSSSFYWCVVFSC